MAALVNGLLEGFLYRRSSSPVHARDPRVRLIFPLSAALASVLAHGLPATLSILGSLIAFSFIAGTLRRISRLLAFAFSFSALILVFSLLGGNGFASALASGLRFAGVVIALSGAFLLVSPEELELVARWFRVPRDLRFALITAVRFVPVLLADLTEITNAQASRGLRVRTWNPFKFARNVLPLIVPLGMIALMRSEELADAVMVRGYGTTKRPTSLHELRADARDIAFASASAVAGVALTCLALL